MMKSLKCGLLICLVNFIIALHSTKASSESVLEIAAVGNPFKIGMLYDARTEELVSGMTLWDDDVIETNTMIKKHEYSNIYIKSSTSLTDKLDILDVNADLKISIMDGGVEITGMAQFINEEVDSSLQIKRSLKYSSKSSFHQLSMEALADDAIQYRDVITSSPATHVVTGIVYGQDAVLTFSKTASTVSDLTSVYGELEFSVNCIPNVTIEASGKLNVTSSESDIFESIDVQFYGDFSVDKPPSTFEEAVELYARLPALLRATAAVPKIVYLYPLSKFDANAEALEDSVSEELFEYFLEILAYLDDINTACNEYMGKLDLDFEILYSEIENFKNLVKSYKSSLQISVASKVIDIKKGISGAASGMKTFLKNEMLNSIFNKENLNLVMSAYKLRATVISTVTTDLNAIIYNDNLYPAKVLTKDAKRIVELRLNTHMVDEWTDLLKKCVTDNVCANNFNFNSIDKAVTNYITADDIIVINRFTTLYQLNEEFEGGNVFAVREFSSADVDDNVQFLIDNTDKYDDLKSSTSFTNYDTKLVQSGEITTIYTSARADNLIFYSKEDSSSSKWIRHKGSRYRAEIQLEDGSTHQFRILQKLEDVLYPYCKIKQSKTISYA